MNRFDVYNPTRLKFGEGIVKELAEDVATMRFSGSGVGSRALLVYGGGSIRHNGAYDDVTRALQHAAIDFVEHPGVVGNPLWSHAQEGIALAKEHRVDFVVAVGGGSVIDEAKAIALGALYDGDVWDFYCQKVAATKALPLVAVLTLPATASEMNGISVLTHDNSRDKNALVAPPVLNPVVSYLDPSYTTTISLGQTGFAAADIISHATEGYFLCQSKSLLPQDELIEGIVRSVRSAVVALRKNPTDVDARGSLMWSATLAWNGILQAGIPGMGLPCHALEMPMSGIYDVAHGAGLSIVTTAWMRNVADMHGERIIRFAQRCLGVEGDVEAAACAMESLYLDIGAPLKLSEVGITQVDIPRMTDLADAAFTLRRVTGYDHKRIARIYNACL